MHFHADFILAERQSFWPPKDRNQDQTCRINALGQEGVRDLADAQAIILRNGSFSTKA